MPSRGPRRRTLGPYVEGGTLAKQRRLKAEAVEIRGETVDLARYGQDRFRSDRPLERLRRLQEALAAKVSLRPPRRMPKIVGGLDVSYPRPDEGVAAYALVDLDAGQLLWSKTVRRPVRFPYITSYLTFRELPILMDLLDEVRAAGRMAPVLLVDGSGILHPRQAGIASHLGVVAAVPTIGVTKTLLCGRVEIEGMRRASRGRSSTRIGPSAWRCGRRRAAAGRSSSRPAIAWTWRSPSRWSRRLLLGRRLPEPLYWADRLSRMRP